MKHFLFEEVLPPQMGRFFLASLLLIPFAVYPCLQSKMGTELQSPVSPSSPSVAEHGFNDLRLGEALVRRSWMAGWKAAGRNGGTRPAASRDHGRGRRERVSPE